MQVTNIKLQNFRKLKEFEATFEGGVYLITGENKQGKSTLLDAIQILLTGQRTDNNLTDNEEKGFIRMETGGDRKYEVELRYTKANPRGIITVKDMETKLSTTRQTMLQEIFKYQEFDASEFLSMSNTADGRKRQVQIITALLPKPILEEIEKVDAEYSKTYEERRQANATVSSLQGEIKGIGKPDNIEEVEKLEVKDIEQLKATEQKRRDMTQQAYDKIREGRELVEKEKRIEGAIEYKTKEVEELKVRLEQIQKDISESETYIAEQRKQLSETKKAVERKRADLAAFNESIPADVTEELLGAESHNNKIEQAARYRAKEKELQEAITEAAKKSENLDALQAKKSGIIKDGTNGIVPGLEITEDGLMLEGRHFRKDTVSTSEAVVIATRIIMAANPTTKVFRISRGESLGQEALDGLVEFATKNGYQGFIEQVERGQEMHITNYTAAEDGDDNTKN
jgi:DNA repair exonuclease SbcCD ATPase subunit